MSKAPNNYSSENNECNYDSATKRGEKNTVSKIVRHTRLSDHTFKNGKFITPLNSIPEMSEVEDEKSWPFGRLPEYLWIGLILRYYGREVGFIKINAIIAKIHEVAPTLETVRMSQILLLNLVDQKKIWNYIVDVGAKEALNPLTVVLTVSKAPVFAKIFYCPDHSLEDRCNSIVLTMNEAMDHQSNLSTDIRFVALYFFLLSGKMHLQKDQIYLLDIYPRTKHSEEIMRMARPNVRAIESLILYDKSVDSDYLNEFWRCLSEMTDCTLFVKWFPEENRDISCYMNNLHEVFEYLASLYTSVEPLDNKMNVLLGIATYSYLRFKEAYEKQLFNSVSGRSCIRVMIEDYIMMKYLVKNESAHANIWRDFQLYGMGAYKLVLERHRESESGFDSHFAEEYVESLVNEYKSEEFIDMDTKYFDKQNIRNKAEAVGEKELYGLFYDYDSSFEHGLWGAIREVALSKCSNPAHQYHCVPNIDGPARLKTVLPDCMMIMKKTLLFINEMYGIPQKLLDEVIDFELKYFTEENLSDTK